MLDLLFLPDNDILRKKIAVRTLFDPAAGTGGMLSEAAKYMRELNPDATLVLFGQDFNPEAYAICGSEMFIKGEEIEKIQFGDSLGDGRTSDAFPHKNRLWYSGFTENSRTLWLFGSNVSLNRETGSKGDESFALGNRADVLFNLGKLQEAKKSLEDAIAYTAHWISRSTP